MLVEKNHQAEFQSMFSERQFAEYKKRASGVALRAPFVAWFVAFGVKRNHSFARIRNHSELLLILTLVCSG